MWGVLQAKVNLALPDLTDPQTRDDFMKQKLWVLFRRVGAVLLFDELRLVTARVNYIALPENQLSHAAVACLETAMRAAGWQPFTFLPRDHWHLHYPE